MQLMIRRLCQLCRGSPDNDRFTSGRREELGTEMYDATVGEGGFSNVERPLLEIHK